MSTSEIQKDFNTSHKALEVNTESNLLRHAKYEMQLAWGKFEDMDEMQQLMCNQVLELLEVLSKQGDSGSSIVYKMNLFKRLVSFETISPLTFNDDEFGEPFNLDGIKQNKRNSKFFLHKDGRISGVGLISYLQAHTCYVTNEEPKFEANKEPISWSGGTFVLMNDGTIERIHRCFIKDKTKYSKQFKIECFDIEYPEDWWTRFTTEDRIKEAREYYDIPFGDSEKLFNKEVYEFEDGKHSDEILKRIELLKEYIKQLDNK